MNQSLSFLTGQKIALLTNIPRPYRVPLFEALSQQIGEAGGELQIFFYSDPSKHLRRQGTSIPNGRYTHTSVNGPEIRLAYDRVLSFPLPLWPALRQYQPHLLISGAFGVPGLVAWAYGRYAHIPIVQWSGANARHTNPLTSFAQGFLARQAAACLTYGTVARQHLIALGANPAKVVAGVNVVNTQFFAQGIQNAQAEVRAFQSQKPAGHLHLLCVSNLVERKGLEYLLTAVSQLPTPPSFTLHLVGDGPQKEALQAQTAALNLTDFVHFWGQQPHARMPFFYALANLFVFPTLDDVWGLVLNEAMACGLPVVVSCFAGAAQDLVVNGRNGFIVDPRQTSELAQSLQTLLTSADLRQQFGQEASQTIQDKATLAHSVNAFLQAIQLALPTIPVSTH